MSVLHDLINNDFYCECRKDVVETTSTSYVEVSPDIGIILKCEEEVLRARKGDLIEQLVYVDPETSQVTTITGALHQVMVITKRINQRDYIRLEGLIIDRSKEFNADLVRIPIANIRGFKGNSSSPEDIKIYNIKLEGDTLSFATLFEPSMVMWNGEAIDVTIGTGSSASEGSTYTATVPTVLKNNTLTIVGTGTSVTTRTVEGVVPGVDPTLDDKMVVDVVNGMSALYKALANTPTEITPDSTMYVPILHGVYGAAKATFLSGTTEIATYDVADAVDVYLGAGVAEAAFITADDNTLCVLAPVLANMMVNHPEIPITVEVNGFSVELCETPVAWVQPLSVIDASLYGSLDPEDSILFAGNEATVERSSSSVGAAITLADATGVRLNTGAMLIEHNVTDANECYFITMAGDPDPSATLVVNTNTATRSARAVTTTTETLNLFVPGAGKGEFKVIFKDVLPKAKPEIAAGYNGTRAVKAIKDIQAEMEAMVGTSDVLNPTDVDDLLYMPLLAHIDEQFTALNMHVTSPSVSTATAELDGGDDGDAETETLSYAETDTVEVTYNGVTLEAAPFRIDAKSATVEINVLLLAYLAVLDLKENLIIDVDGVLVALPDLTEFAGELPVTGVALIGGTHATNKVEFVENEIDATVSDYSAAVAFSLGTDAATTLPAATIGLMVGNDYTARKVRNMEFVKMDENDHIATVNLCNPENGAVVGDVEASGYTSNRYAIIVPGFGADVVSVNTTFNPPIAIGPEFDNDSTQDAMAAALDNPTLTDDSYVMLAENVDESPKQVTLRFTSGSITTSTKTATLTPDMMIRVGDASNMASVPVLKHRYDNLMIHVAVIARLKELFSDTDGTIEIDIHGETISASTLERSGIFNTVGVKNVELLNAQHSVEEASNDGNVVTVSRYFNTTGVKIYMDFEEDLAVEEQNAKAMVIYSDPIPEGNADITSVIGSIAAMVTNLPGKKFEIVCVNGPSDDGIIAADSTTTADISNVTLKASADVRVIWDDHASNTVPITQGRSEEFTTENVAKVMNAVIDSYGPSVDTYVKTESGEWALGVEGQESPDPTNVRFVGAIETIVGIGSYDTDGVVVKGVDFITVKGGVEQSHMIQFEQVTDGRDVIYPNDKEAGYYTIPIGPAEEDKISVPRAFLQKNPTHGKYTLYINTVAAYPLIHDVCMDDEKQLKVALYASDNSEIYSTVVTDIETASEELNCDVQIVGGWHELPPEENALTVTKEADGNVTFDAVKYDTAFATRHKWYSSDPVNKPVHGYFVYTSSSYSTATIGKIVKVDSDGYVAGYRPEDDPANVESDAARTLIDTEVLVFPTLYVTTVNSYVTLKTPTFKGKQYRMSDSCTKENVATAFETYTATAPDTTPDRTTCDVEIMEHRLDARPTRVVFKHTATELPSGVDPVIAIYRPGFYSETEADTVSTITMEWADNESAHLVMDTAYTEADSNGKYHLEINAMALLEIFCGMVDADNGDVVVDIYTDDGIDSEPTHRTMLTATARPEVDQAIIASVEGKSVVHTTPPYINTVEFSVDADGTHVVTISRFDTGYDVTAVFETDANGSLPGALYIEPKLTATGVQGDRTIDTVHVARLNADGSRMLLEAEDPSSDLTASSSHTGTPVGIYFTDPTIERDISYIRYRVDIRNKITETARPVNPVASYGNGFLDAVNATAQRYVYTESNNGVLPPEMTEAEKNSQTVLVTSTLPAEGNITSIVVGVYNTSDNETIFSNTYEAKFSGTDYTAPDINIRLKTDPNADLGTISAYRTVDNGDGTRALYVSWIALYGAFTRLGQSKIAGRDEYYAVDVFTTAPEHYHHQIKLPFDNSNTDVIDLGISSASGIVGEGGTHSASPYVNRATVRNSENNAVTIDVVRYDTGYGVKVPLTGINVTNTNRPSSSPIKEWVVGTVGGTDEFTKGKGIDVIYLERTDAQGNMYLIPPNTTNPKDVVDAKETPLYTQWVFAPMAKRFTGYWCGRVNIDGTLTELPPKSPDLSNELNSMNIRKAFEQLDGHASSTVVEFTESEFNALRVPVLDRVLQVQPMGIRFESSDGDQYECYNSTRITPTSTTLYHYTEKSMGSMPVMLSEANATGLYDLKVSAISMVHVLRSFTGDITAHIYNNTEENCNAYKAGTLQSKDGDIVLAIPNILEEVVDLEAESFPMVNGTLNYAPKNHTEWGTDEADSFRNIDIYRYEESVTAYAKMRGVMGDGPVEVDMRAYDEFIYINRDRSENTGAHPLNAVNVGGLHANGYVTMVQGDASSTVTFNKETTTNVRMEDIFVAPIDREVNYIGVFSATFVEHHKVVPAVVATPEATNIWDTAVNDQIKEVLNHVIFEDVLNTSTPYEPAAGMDDKVMISVGTFAQKPYFVEIEQINARYEAQNHMQRIGYPVGVENEINPGDTKFRLHMTGYNNDKVWEMDAVTSTLDEGTGRYEVKVNILAYLEQMYAAAICDNDFRFVIWYNDTDRPVWVQVNHNTILPEIRTVYGTRKTIPHGDTISNYTATGGYHNRPDGLRNSYTTDDNSVTGNVVINRYDSGYNLAFQFNTALVPHRVATEKYLYFVKDKVSNKYNDMYRISTEAKRHPLLKEDNVVKYHFDKAKTAKYAPLGMISFSDNGSSVCGWYETVDLTINDLVDENWCPEVSEDYNVENLIKGYNAMAALETATEVTPEMELACYVPIIDDVLPQIPTAIRLAPADSLNYPPNDFSTNVIYLKNDQGDTSGATHQFVSVYKGNDTNEITRTSAYYNGQYDADAASYGIRINALILLKFMRQIEGTKDFVVQVFYDASTVDKIAGDLKFEIIVPNLIKLAQAGRIRTYTSGGIHVYDPERNTASYGSDYTSSYGYAFTATRYDRLGYAGIEYTTWGYPDGIPASDTPRKYFTVATDDATGSITRCRIHTMSGEGYNQIALLGPDEENIVPTNETKTKITSANYLSMASSPDNREIYYAAYSTMDVYEQPRIGVVDKSEFNFGTSHLTKTLDVAYTNVRKLLTENVAAQYDTGTIELTNEQKELCFASISTDPVLPFKPISARLYHLDSSSFAPISPERSSTYGELWQYPTDETHPDNTIAIHVDDEASDAIVTMPVLRTSQASNGNWTLEVNVLSLLSMIHIGARFGYVLKLIVYMVNDSKDITTRSVLINLTNANNSGEKHIRMKIADARLYNPAIEENMATEDYVVIMDDNSGFTLTRCSTESGAEVKLTGDIDGNDTKTEHVSRLTYKLLFDGAIGRKGTYRDMVLTKTNADGYAVAICNEDPGSVNLEPSTDTAFVRFMVDTYGTTDPYVAMYVVNMTIVNEEFVEDVEGDEPEFEETTDDVATDEDAEESASMA